MLQTLRDKLTGWIAYTFFGAIAIVFIFGIAEMRSGGGVAGNYAARVNGDRIPAETARQAAQLKLNEFQQGFNGQLPEALTKQLQQAALSELITKQLLVQYANEVGFRVSDTAFREAVSQVPQWQVDGKFSFNLYNAEARQRGISPQQFDRDLRFDLLRQHLISGVTSSSFVTPSELQRRQALEGEQREVDYAVIPASSYLATAKVGETDIQTWYDGHKAEFMTEETVDLEYVEFRLADVEKEVAVTDEALQARYEETKERFTTPERRRARQILISVAEGADDASAKAKAEEVLGKLKAGGDFAALAKQYSQDEISAANGGLLDWQNKGGSLGAFDDAVFSTSVGEVRGPIRSEFGYHIVKLEAKEGGDIKPFAAVRDELASELKSEKGQSLFYDRSQKLADEAFNTAGELDTAAKALGLSVQKISGFSRRGGGALGNNPKIVDAAFEQDAIEKRQNSALIQVADDHIMVLRVTEHHAAEQKPLTAVQTEIETALKQQFAKEAAAKRGAELLAKVETGADWSKTIGEFKLTSVSTKSVTRVENSIPVAIRQAAFAVPRSAVTAGKSAFRGTAVDSGDYTVVRVTAIRPGTLENGSAEFMAKRQQAVQSVTGEEYNAYLSDIESRADIQRNPNVFE